MGDVSNTRLYLGNLPRNATKADVENHFASHGTGEITEIKLMNGFGFLEYKDAMDARDVVPAFHGSDFQGERLVVQFARGSNRPRDFDGREPRAPPRPRRTVHRMTITGLPFETSWQDLKDFARQPGLDVVYSEVGRDGGSGTGFVEYETEADLATAVEKLDNSEFKGATVGCVSDPQSEIPRMPPPRDRYRSRSPGGRGGYGGRGPPRDDYYDRRGPPRGGYSPRRDDHSYRRRSPPPRDYYSDRRGGGDSYGRSPPRARGPPMDDYPPPRRPAYGAPDDVYAGGPPPPRRGGYEPEPYANGHGREPRAPREPREPREPYGRPASPPPRRDRGYGDGPEYERRAYW